MDRQKRFRRQKCSTFVLGAQAKEELSLYNNYLETASHRSVFGNFRKPPRYAS